MKKHPESLKLQAPCKHPRRASEPSFCQGELGEKLAAEYKPGCAQECTPLAASLMLLLAAAGSTSSIPDRCEPCAHWPPTTSTRWPVQPSQASLAQLWGCLRAGCLAAGHTLGFDGLHAELIADDTLEAHVRPAHACRSCN